MSLETAIGIYSVVVIFVIAASVLFIALQGVQGNEVEDRLTLYILLGVVGLTILILMAAAALFLMKVLGLLHLLFWIFTV